MLSLQLNIIKKFTAKAKKKSQFFDSRA